jgi:uncharacterized protein YgiM (DUF1202 family)
MRVAVALLAVGLAVGAARAESTRRTAVVEVDGVEVRSGCAHSYPAVGQLKKGDTVIVVREEDTGFLAILPATGTVSWLKQIHLGKVEELESGKTNVTVAVEGAEVVAGSDKDHPPTNRVTVHLPKGSIVEVVGPAVRVGNASWYPITPPEGDLRWVPKSAIKASSLSALAPPPPYVRPDTPAFTVSADGSKPPARPATATLPAALTDHRLWAKASEAEAAADYSTAKALYARIYQDLWDQKAERDAIVICYNRYTRCDNQLKQGDAPPRTRSESRSEAPPTAAAGGKWNGPGYLQELQKVYLDGQPVFALQDDRGSVLYYVTAVQGLNLRNYVGKRVQLYGPVSTRPELYKPHIGVERVEVAK